MKAWGQSGVIIRAGKVFVVMLRRMMNSGKAIFRSGNNVLELITKLSVDFYDYYYHLLLTHVCCCKTQMCICSHMCICLDVCRGV